MSSDEEDERRSEEPTEAELALRKRREAQKKESKGLDESAKELLQSNKEERHRMEDEIAELRQRNERRKKEREIEEKRLASERAAEEERRKAAEEEKRRKKDEEEEKKRKERSQRMAEFEKMKNPGNKPNFIISKRSEDDDDQTADDEKPGVVRKSKEQLEAEKKAILSQRIQPLSTGGLDAAKLAEKARELHKTIYRLESEKYDHEKRFKAQQVDMMELAERARQANKVGRGGLKRIQVAAEDVDDVQARFSGAPAKIEMYSKYERQTDKRPYKEKKCVYGGPTWAMPVEKIKPTKIVRWNEEGLPMYKEKEDVAPANEATA